MEVLVVHDGESKAVFAHVVNRRGGSGEGAVRAAAEDLDLLGYKRILLKGDQEPALKELRSRAEAEWAGEAVLEHSPIGSSQSNGAVERAMRSVEEQVRVVKDAVEERTGCALAAGHPATYAARPDGLTQHCVGPLASSTALSS